MASDSLLQYWKYQFSILTKKITEDQWKKIRDIDYYKGDSLSDEAKKIEHRCKHIQQKLSEQNL